MSNLPVELPEEHVDMWKAKLPIYTSVSTLIRDLAKEYAATRNDAGVMLYSLFDGFSLEELSCIWRWDFKNNGEGVSDERLDELLAHLLENVNE